MYILELYINTNKIDVKKKPNVNNNLDVNQNKFVQDIYHWLFSFQWHKIVFSAHRNLLVVDIVYLSMICKRNGYICV